MAQFLPKVAQKVAQYLPKVAQKVAPEASFKSNVYQKSPKSYQIFKVIFIKKLSQDFSDIDHSGHTVPILRTSCPAIFQPDVFVSFSLFWLFLNFFGQHPFDDHERLISSFFQLFFMKTLNLTFFTSVLEKPVFEIMHNIY